MQTEDAQSLSSFKNIVRETLVRDEQPNISEAEATILRNERRPSARVEDRHDRLIVQSMISLEEGNVFSSDDNVVPHRVNPDHNENRSEQEKRDHSSRTRREHYRHWDHFPDQIFEYQKKTGERPG